MSLIRFPLELPPQPKPSRRESTMGLIGAGLIFAVVILALIFFVFPAIEAAV